MLLFNGSPGPDNTTPDNAGLNALRPRTDGFGPAVTFGRSMADYYVTSNQSVALIQYAKDGSSLNVDWKAGGTAGTSGDGTHYQNFQSAVTQGMAALAQQNPGRTIILRGMIWMQGETDAFTTAPSNAYQVNLAAFIADFRLTYGSNVPFVIGKLSTAQTLINTTNLGIVRNAQEAVKAATPNSAIVNTDTFGILSDNIHFNAAGQQSLGYGFATAMQGLLSNPVPNPDGSYSFTTLADARVDSTTPTTKYGSDVAIGVQSASRTMNSYLRFSIGNLPGTITSAKLRIKESPTGTSNSANCPMACA